MRECKGLICTQYPIHIAFSDVILDFNSNIQYSCLEIWNEHFIYLF